MGVGCRNAGDRLGDRLRATAHFGWRQAHGPDSRRLRTQRLRCASRPPGRAPPDCPRFLRTPVFRL